MPVIKSTPGGPEGANFHVVHCVEFFRLDGALCWRGKHMSYNSANTSTTPTAVGTLVGVPVTDFSVDPIEAFEKACIAHPGNVFSGGEYVPPGQEFAPLGLEKSLAWARVKLGRDAYLDAGVTTSVGVFDSDLNTLVNVLGAAATMLDGDSRGWILADHTPVVLTKAQVLELGAALAALRDSTYEQGSALYAQIQAAQTPEEARSVSWAPPA